MNSNKSLSIVVVIALLGLTSACGPQWKQTIAGPTKGLEDGPLPEDSRLEETDFLESVSVVGDLISGMDGKRSLLRPWDPKLCNVVAQRGYLFPEIRTIEYHGPRNIGQGPMFPFRLKWPLDVESNNDSVLVMRSLSAGAPTHSKARHDGIDFAARAGAPIRAAADGEVLFLGWEDSSRPRRGYGQFIILVHRLKEGSIEEAWITLYAHLARFHTALQRDQRVRAGQIIGYVGSTGHSTGPHLHFELRHQCEPFNPALRFVPTVDKVKGLAGAGRLPFGN